MKRILSTIMSAALLATSAYMPVSAFEEGTVAFPFTMFAASDAEGALTLNTSYACVNGKIATNGTVASSGSMTVNGAIKENAGEEMVYIPTKINENYFSGSGLTVEEGDYVLEQTHINLNSALAATGSLTVSGNLNLYAGLKALNDVTLTGSAVNAGNALLYSETGDININVSNFNFSGLIYAPFGNVTIDSDYISLNSVVVLAQTITINSIGLNANYGRGVGYLVGTESEATDTYRLVAGGNYLEEENSIEVSWDTDCEEPQSFRVLTSETGTAYTAAATVTEGRSYLYPVDDDFDTMYFKVEMTTEEGRKVQSAPFIMTKTEAGFEITYPDTDGDGLPDNYEIMVGTDIRKPDTDGDGLTDYQEVILTLTDPLVVDSFTEGVSDADADCDEDGLTNAEEIALGTDPRMADTDKDGLSDSDEVNEYNTDPLNADTDGDGVKDGDEIAYGLDPNKQDTDEDGVSDADENVAYTVTDKQIASTLKKNNTAVPTELTVNTRIGDGTKLKVKKYSGHLLDDDRFVVGKVLEISGAEFEGGHIAFTLSDDFTVPTYTIAGTETNGLLICYNDGTETMPLATSFDAETRVLSADMESEGCYFIMDLMDWMNSMGIDPETFYTEPETESEEDEEIPEETPAAPAPKMAARALRAPGSTTIANIPIRGQVDIVFVVDTTGSMRSYINNVRDNLIAFVNDIESAGIKPYFALVEYRDITHDGVNSTKVKRSASGSYWFSNANEYKAEIAKLTVNGGGDIEETAIDGLEAARRLNLRTSAQKFFILVTDAGYKVNNNYGISSMNEMISLLNAKNINTSVVSGSGNRSTYSSLFTQTHGIFADVSGNFKSELLRIAGMIDEETNNGTWIALAGIVPKIVKLNAKPTAGSDTDTDGDGISDVDELGGATPDKYMNVSELLYALGLPRTITDGQIAYYSYNSDPTKKDTDNDGLEDNEDNRPRQKGYYDESVDDVVIGELAIISSNDGSFYGGHAFFGYQSYVNDELDFSDIYGGYGSTNHYPMVADVYPIKRDEYISIGGAANDTGVDQDDFLSTTVPTIGFAADSIAYGENPGAATGGGSGDVSGALNSSGVASGSGLGMSSGSGSAASSGSGSSGISGSGSASGLSGAGLAALLTEMDGGVLFNRELQGIYTGYASYESNYALTHKLTQDQWDDMMDYMEDNNYYIFLRHNCTTIATEAWNRIFDDNLNAAFSGIVTTETPKRLKESLKNRSGSITNYLARIRSDK